MATGAINQTIFNYYHDYPLDYGIKDFDIVYFDCDTSYTAEDKVIKTVKEQLKEFALHIDTSTFIEKNLDDSAGYQCIKGNFLIISGIKK
ncbi:MAG: hypothetical protein HFJ12_01860 [Bacilli bacterium]|nr:hypothetical protein [Bacilli bacterium]